MIKRLAAASLALVLTLGLFCMPAFAEGETPVFSDVKSGDWYYTDVMSLYTAGVVNGFGDGSFKPGSTVTTGQALKMVLLAAGYSEPDPVASHWARGYLNLALDKDILARGEITDLDVNIQRVLVAKIAAVSLGLRKTQESYYFTDTKDDNVQALYEAGILNGYADGTFQPDKPLTRAELSAIVYRIYQYKQKQNTNSEPVNDLDKLTPADIPLRTTEDGIAFIKAREGFVSKSYKDYSQYSIGYGSYCTPDEYPDGITEKQADILLRLNLDKVEDKLDAFIKENGISLRDTQYDALASFTYNVGSGWMNSSYRLAKLLISGSYTDNEFAAAFGIWCHVTVGGTTSIHDGLIARRVREMRLFLYGDYEAKNSDDFCYLIFKTDAGSVGVDISFYKRGGNYDNLPEATNGDSVFSGWYTSSGEKITQDTTVDDNYTVTAQWDQSTD